MDSVSTPPPTQGVMERLEKDMRRLLGLCYHVTHDAHDAEDLLQDVCVLILRKGSSFKDEREFFPWAARIIWNRWVQIRRKKGLNALPLIEEADGAGEANTRGAPLPLDALELAEDNAALGEAMASLSPDHREVIVLYHMEDMAYQEIAEVLGLPVTTVKTRLHHARCKLRDLLKGNPTLGE